MHHSLITKCILVGISLEVKHQNFNHVAVSSCSRQMYCLRPHVGVPVQSQGPLSDVVVCKFMPHLVQNQACLLKADELQQVHVVIETE